MKDIKYKALRNWILNPIHITIYDWRQLFMPINKEDGYEFSYSNIASDRVMQAMGDYVGDKPTNGNYPEVEDRAKIYLGKSAKNNFSIITSNYGRYYESGACHWTGSDAIHHDHAMPRLEKNHWESLKSFPTYEIGLFMGGRSEVWGHQTPQMVNHNMMWTQIIWNMIIWGDKANFNWKILDKVISSHGAKKYKQGDSGGEYVKPWTKDKPLTETEKRAYDICETETHIGRWMEHVYAMRCGTKPRDLDSFIIESPFRS